MPNKNINESKHPFACQDGLKKLRFGRLGWPSLFWIVAEFIHQETCLLPFCLPKFEEIQQLLESPKVEVVQPFRSGEVGKNTTANAMINDYFVCAESPWKFNECTPFNKKKPKRHGYWKRTGLVQHHPFNFKVPFGGG